MLLNSKLRLSVAVMSLVIGTQAFASNNNNNSNNDLDEQGRRITFVAADTTKPKTTKFVPQTWAGWFAHKTGIMSEDKIREWGESYGYEYPESNSNDMIHVDDIIDEFEQMGSAAEIDIEIEKQNARKAKEDAEADLRAQAMILHMIRCTAESYGDDFDSLKPEEIAYLTEAYDRGDFGDSYIRLREGNLKRTKSFEEKLNDLKTSAQSKSIQNPKPKYWIGKLAAYLITDKGAVALGRQLGISYEDEAAEPEQSVKPVKRPSTPVLSHAEEKILATFAGLSEENQQRLMMALENGKLDQLILDTAKSNNSPVEENAEQTVIPEAPVFTAPAPAVVNNKAPASLLDGIKQGVVLKKTKPSEKKDSDSSDDSDDKVNLLAKGLLALRGKIDGTAQEDSGWNSDDE